jgi:hypothetical protein
MIRYLFALPFIAVFAFAAACTVSRKLPSTPTPPASAATATVAASTPSPGATAAATGTPSSFGGGTAAVTITPVPSPATNAALLTDVRVGAHDEDGGYDRIVFEFDSQIPAGAVGYVDTVSQCASGAPVALQGSAILLVKFTSTNAHDEAGNITIDSQQISGPGGSILESKQTCDFEADVTWGIGVKGLKPFRVQILQGPPRVVVDVQH